MSSDVPKRPVVGITMGDASGIGPEIVLKALLDSELLHRCRCVVIGDARTLESTADNLGIRSDLIPFRPDSGAAKAEVLDLANLPSTVRIGTDAAETGKAAAEYIEAAVTLLNDDQIDAVCTAPISKKAISLAGYDYSGHTEFLAALTNTDDFAMSFFADKLRVVLLSTHLPLTEAIKLITTDALVKLIMFTHREMGRLLGKDVSIAVAGLNPHASEGGLFGNEEADHIEPAISHCRSSLGINVTGPYSPDTVFIRAAQGEFDACIALYHDQATIPVKALSFGAGVNVTLGLPFIRTSVDHGTAYDIAGRGIADASSLIEAIKLAGELASVRENRG